MKKIFFETKDNLKLCGILEEPKTQTDKCVILAHGITVNKSENGLHEILANELIKKNIASFRFDFRGHGESGGKQEDMTIEGELEDLRSTYELIAKSFKNISLLGASFGGGITTLFAATNKFKINSICLWNPVLNYDHVFLNPYLPWLKNITEKTKTDLEKQGWTKLGRSGFKTGSKLFQEMKDLKPFLLLNKINCPVLIIHGDKDTKVPYKDSVDYLNVFPNAKLITVKSAEHGFHESWESKIAIEETINFLNNYF